jgi:hypothetical protein
MSDDRKQQRLEVLRRLRELAVEEARAGHLAARDAEKSAESLADATRERLQALDIWAGEQLTGERQLPAELLRQAQQFRRHEAGTLDSQLDALKRSTELTEKARAELTSRFEQLSVIERLSVRTATALAQVELRNTLTSLDEAGVQRHNQVSKE